jgi:hypothetical protein
MDGELVNNCLAGAFAGTMTFGETIVKLRGSVEWYSANLILRCSTHYGADGSSHQTPWPEIKLPEIGHVFVENMVITALRRIQRRESTYPDFLQEIAAAGVTYYTVHLQGRRAIYFGRHGDFYIEEFPPQF